MNIEPEGLDVERLLYQWPMSEPWTLQPTGAGVNNVNMFVTTPSARYVLRIYQQSTTEAVEYEHSVLTALGTADLPFAIPVPLATHTATTSVHLAESNHLACLVPRLSGEAPQEKNLRQARTAGEALGLLVEALARVSTPCGSPKYAPYADLQAYLPPGHTAASALAAAPTLDDAAKRELTVLFARVEAAIPVLWPTLPRQLVHRDYWPTNVLMDGDQVAAILDFEFAGEDIRALDFAIGLTWWAMFQDNLESWEMLGKQIFLTVPLQPPVTLSASEGSRPRCFAALSMTG